MKNRIWLCIYQDGKTLQPCYELYCKSLHRCILKTQYTSIFRTNKSLKVVFYLFYNRDNMGIILDYDLMDL